ncbi:peptidase inhibitor family I36 protein [Lentzea alba]|uniref:peptidase inhibitor family I36 protein n=1 Tax=Lentzea alba TaxID=2714351 RepID=UPI0039BF68B9
MITRSLSRIIFGGSLSLALLFVASLMGGASAVAAPACPSTLCVWEHHSFQGRRIDFGHVLQERSMKNRVIGSHATMNDRISSFVSNHGGNLCFYEHEDFRGLEFRIGPRESWGSMPRWINDKISSFRAC